MPPHLVAKAAKALGSEPFDRVHNRLLTAYFSGNLDISDDQVLRNLWRDLDLPDEGFDKREDPNLKEAIFQEHNRAIENGATGVPAMQMAGGFGAILGAQPIESYRLWFQRMLDRRSEEPERA